jgi:hypothetical protein
MNRLTPRKRFSNVLCLEEPEAAIHTPGSIERTWEKCIIYLVNAHVI